jgi:hypothetical protein
MGFEDGFASGEERPEPRFDVGGHEFPVVCQALDCGNLVPAGTPQLLVTFGPAGGAARGLRVLVAVCPACSAVQAALSAASGDRTAVTVLHSGPVQ